MLLDHADFALQEQAEDNLMVVFLEHSIMAHIPWLLKPIKFLELHYTMIQFLINSYIPHCKLTPQTVQNLAVKRLSWSREF